MIPESVFAVFAAGESADEFDDAAGKKQSEREDGAELDDDGVHLPVRVVEADVEERFAMRRWAVELTGRNSVRPSTIPRSTEIT